MEPEVHYCFHKSSPLIPILEKSINFHFLPFGFFKIHFTVTLRVVYFLQILQPETINVFLFCPLRAICPANLFLIELIIRVMYGEEQDTRSSSLCSFPHYYVTSCLFLVSQVSFGTLFSNTLSLLSY